MKKCASCDRQIPEERQLCFACGGYEDEALGFNENKGKWK